MPTIRDRLKDPNVLSEIAKVLPAHCSPERMARVALTALTKTPKLAQCTEASFFQCLLSLSQWGLEPDGRRAHLIPYGTTCSLIVDYKGFVELAYRSGMAKNIHAAVVYRGDVFVYTRGKVIEHTPWDFRTDEARPPEAGEVYAAYCIVELQGGAEHHEVMTKAAVEAIRKRSKAGSSGPWVTDWEEMAKKTVFRRASKWIPMSADILDAIDRDADTPEGLTPRNGLARAPAISLADNVIDADDGFAFAQCQAEFAGCESKEQVAETLNRWSQLTPTNEIQAEVDKLAEEAHGRFKTK